MSDVGNMGGVVRRNDPRWAEAWRLLAETSEGQVGPGLHGNDVRPFLDLADAMFLEVDANGRVEFINEHGLELLGCPADEIVGENWFERCVPADERETARQRFAQRFEGEHPDAVRTDFETAVITKSGELRRIKWSQLAISGEEQGLRRLLASGHDVTAQREAEASLESILKELRAYKLALDQSSILAITDRRGRITFVNDRFCEISKYTREELIGQDHRLLNSGEHPKAFFQQMWRTIASGQTWQGDIKNRAKDGTHYWVATTIVPVLDEITRKPREYIAVRNEITGRKEAEAKLETSVAQLAEANRRLREEHEKLLQAEKMASVGLLAAGVAHEINNPLSGVMACLKALEEGTVRPERREQYFATARDGLERIQQTVRGLLDYSRQRSPAPAHISISEVVQTCSRLIAPLVRKRGVSIVLEPNAERASVLADRPQLMQAMVNLLLNAAYVAPERSEVSVDVVEGEHDDVGIRISDDGPGMTDDVIARACDPFFTTKPEGEGTGLGLAVTQSIAQAHGGRLEFERRPPPESGTLVTIWLPNRKVDLVTARDSARG
jgi:PAS domain S-box-containing protein